MQGGEVIRRARRWADLSTEELAALLDVPTATVEAWEESDPPLSVVERAVSATGHELHRVLAEPDPDPHDLALIDESLRLTVDERFERLMNYVHFVEAGRAAMEATR